MAQTQPITNLRVFNAARELLRAVHHITQHVRFGDTTDQLRRAALSVVSNIAEGAGSGSDKRFANFLRIARGSANELEAQLLILSDIGMISVEHNAIQLANSLGRQLSCFIQRLESSG